MRFTHETLPQRVVFAPGDAPAAVAGEVARLGVRRVMVIAAPAESALADAVSAEVPVAVRHDEVVMHVPVEVAERARAAAAGARADALLCVGGGSTTGLAKAVAMTGSPKAGLPIIAVPTTYAGSEATNVWGLTQGETKTTGVDDLVLPRSIVYDASLMLTLPVEMSVASGLNAMAHCVDSMWGPRADPIDQALAAEGIHALSRGLPAVVADPAGIEGREQTLYGAYLAAVAFASAGSGMHHKICHVLGGMFNLPHAQTHAVVLPHVLAFNAPHAPGAERRIARALGTPRAPEGLADLYAALHAPAALKDYGMPEDGIARAVAPIRAAIPAGNPAPVTEENLTALLRAAWEGAKS
ncbi:maleylacetate reductase [Nonomuraea jiangxiensis]|uniref:Alcohol dehydrogenase, class IV n=1 Tax=Nonomuraea jiangxiensis TaxID=633440 RepID=A0A1G9IX71_9ACTN|nr:maleylacetate reductase [Nonomuraea jiangxiensis]SDL29692.1 Alcohol dehydrogenase, class IV [Nonomuraea jiangxiensis]